MSEKDLPKDQAQPNKSDFSKKPNMIYENTELMVKL